MGRRVGEKTEQQSGDAEPEQSQEGAHEVADWGTIAKRQDRKKVKNKSLEH